MVRKALVMAMLISALSAGQAAASDLWQVGDGFVLRADVAGLQQSSARADLLQDIERAARKLCLSERPRVGNDRCRAEVIASMEVQLPQVAQGMLERARAERSHTQLASAQ